MKNILYEKISGDKLVERFFCKVIEGATCKDLIEEQIEGMNRDEVVDYMVDVFEGIRRIKQKVVNHKLFGQNLEDFIFYS